MSNAPTAPPPGTSEEAKLDYSDPRVTDCINRYWRKNLTVMLGLLSVWALAGLGCGILWADVLNANFNLGGFPLGFWFAQQGAIIIFIFTILAYCLIMNRLDRSHHAELEQLRREHNNLS
jgi:putative solute:sodium symporter small subunit